MQRKSGLACRAMRGAGILSLAVMGLGMGGCQGAGDYFNFRNSFLDPSQVGRFDKANPFGKVEPVTWPIMSNLGVADQTPNQWASATDPTPADAVPEAKEYTLGPGDVVQIEIFELVAPGQPWQRQTRISDTGVLGVQNLGNISVQGLTPSQVEQKIANQLVEAKILPPPGPGQPGPQVNVLLLQSRSRTFSVLGAVSRPGSYEVLTNNFRLLDALALAGDMPSAGGLQGLDNLYVIRQVPYEGGTEGTTPAMPPAGTGPATEPGKPGSASDLLEQIERGGTRPATETAPAGKGPSGRAPNGTPVPMADMVTLAAGPTSAQADLEAALGVPATSTAPAALPAAATQPGLEGVPPTTAPGTLRSPNYVWLDGKWVPVTGGATTGGPLLGGTATAEASGGPLLQQRVIRIPVPALRGGVTKYNIVVKPGDVINIPPVESGEFYMMGNVSRPGVYSLTGRQITLKMAVAAAGNLGPLAIPRRCEVTRRIGADQEAIIQVNMQSIFDGEKPDFFLKPNDVVNVGTDVFAPFLSVTRNAYRLSYGFGFVYDRNYWIQPTR